MNPPLARPVVRPVMTTSTEAPHVACVRVGKVVRLDVYGEIFALYNGSGRAVCELTPEQAKAFSTALAAAAR